MKKKIVIAVDAMGGDNSPKKIIDGIELYHQRNKNIFYKLFGKKNLIENSLKNKKIDKSDYIKMSSKLYFALVEHDGDTAIEVAEVEGALDSFGGEFMNRDQFYQCWFQLAVLYILSFRSM